MRRGVVACMSSNGFVVAQQDQSRYKNKIHLLQRGSMALAEQDIEFIKQHLGEWLTEVSLGKSLQRFTKLSCGSA